MAPIRHNTRFGMPDLRPLHGSAGRTGRDSIPTATGGLGTCSPFVLTLAQQA